MVAEPAFRCSRILGASHFRAGPDYGEKTPSSLAGRSPPPDDETACLLPESCSQLSQNSFEGLRSQGVRQNSSVSDNNRSSRHTDRKKSPPDWAHRTRRL